MLSPGQADRRYAWPVDPLEGDPSWTLAADGRSWSRAMPEPRSAIALDSRWPAFFPSPITLVTTGQGDSFALEKVVGASIVNRFPYVVALSFCREALSDRHYARTNFTDLLERSGSATLQFLPAGEELDRAMEAIGRIPDEHSDQRLLDSGVQFTASLMSEVPVAKSAFLVYETRLIGPSLDLDGRKIFEQPWVDVGSHRVYFLEITAIQLREDIARGESQIWWRSLPTWKPSLANSDMAEPTARVRSDGYSKGYSANYRFPGAGTTAFEWDRIVDGKAVQVLTHHIEMDNDRARWPCFFPQSLGLLTSSHQGTSNLMPCGSTTVVSRSPLVIAPAISYSDINERYARRHSLELIEQSGWFGCGVPFLDDDVIDAIKYTGNVSLLKDPNKLRNSGLRVSSGERVPILEDLPVFFECRVVGRVHLGTHLLLLGQVERIRVRADVTPESPLEWCPWADVGSAAS